MPSESRTATVRCGSGTRTSTSSSVWFQATSTLLASGGPVRWATASSYEANDRSDSSDTRAATTRGLFGSARVVLVELDEVRDPQRRGVGKHRSGAVEIQVAVPALRENRRRESISTAREPACSGARPSGFTKTWAVTSFGMS